MGTITRSYRIRAYPNGAQRRLLDRWFGATRWLWNTALAIRSEEVDRWYPSSKRCSECQYTLDVLRLDERQWRCPGCGICHDRDLNAARNLLMEGLRQLAGRDDRDLRVDAGDACPEEILVQVLAEEARSGQHNRVCLEQARLS
jgi:transposase